MKITLCVNHFPPSVGGCEFVCKHIAEHLAQYHQVTVITRRMKSRNHANFKSYNVIEYVPGDQQKFISTVNDLKPDVVFVYSDMFDYFRHLVTHKDKRFRLVIALCGANWIHCNRTFANILARNVHNIDRLVCHSKIDRDYKFCSNSRLLPKTVVIPNGVDLSEFDNNQTTREQLVEKHKLKPSLLKKKWILNVSNFFPGKGQEHMFPIIDQIKGDFVYLQVCADIPFPIGQQLEIKWKSHLSKFGDKVVLLKNIDRQDVVSLFKQSSVFAFTSEKEVAPIVLLESMAAKVPWVTTDVGNATELQGGKCIRAIKNQQRYSLFDSRVHRLFAQAVESVWGRPAVAEPGRLQIENEMCWEKILPQYMSIVERC